MSIKAETKYNGVVAPGSQLYETQTGTLGYQVMLECTDGPTSFVIWRTQKNRDRARKYFEVLGVDPDLLKDSGYIEYQLGLDIEGREVSFGTKDEEYNGKHSVKVVWIGKRSDPNLSRSAARFFGGTTGDGEIAGEELAF
ncbi:MAG: hypothetical protein LAP85_29585 [Acidobacteriia bacterium]|nr:hypothetical protein [Terriglobia bacterium]